MLSTLHELDNQAYLDFRYSLLFQLEGARLEAYRDSDGIPTIGIGANLRANLGAVIAEMGLNLTQATITQLQAAVNLNYDTDAQVQSAINAILAAAPRPPGTPVPAFTLTLPQAQNLFATIAPNYEQSLNALLPEFGAGNAIGRPSRERAAIFAMAYNVRDFPRFTALPRAILNGNRAEAWFEIRFNTNSVDNGAGRAGIAKRQFVLAQVFGLYEVQDNRTDSQRDAEYKSIFTMYTRHAAAILTYENLFRNNPITLANGDITAIGQVATIGQVQAITNENGTQNLDGTLQAAADFLKSRYVNSYATERPIRQIFVVPDSTTGIYQGLAAVTQVDRSQDTVSDLIFGGQANDVMRGGSAGDIIFGGTGNNTAYGNDGADILVGGTAANFLDGGAGNDTLFLNGTVYRLITNNGPSDWDARTGNGGATTMLGGDGNDKFYIGVFGDTNGSISIDGGAGQDVVSFQGSASTTILVENGGQTSADGKQIVLRNVETVIGTDGNDSLTINVREKTKVKVIGGTGHDVVRINQGDLLISLGDDGKFNSSTKEEAVEVSGVEVIYAPDTDTTIVGSGQAVVNLGNGNNTLMSAGAGSVINAGQGHNVFHLSNQVLLTGVDHDDKVMIGNDVLTGGIRHKGSESPWALGLDFTRYGFDNDGNLIIKDMFGNVMGIANGVSGPGHFDDDSAGIFIAEVSISFVRLADLTAPDPAWQTHQFEYVNAFAKAYGQHVVYAGVDPLVLDLTDTGLHLTDTSIAAPYFDINGNGFAARTGWVQPSSGILALDKNDNGAIDNVGEMFGGPGLNGFAALAAYDLNADGVIDASDAVFSELKVWVDANGNAVTDPNELKSLADLDIVSIDLDSQTLAAGAPGSFIAGNQVLETATFTRGDGTTSTVADVLLHENNYDTRYLGDTTVTAAADGLPNQKGFGTLTDLSVAISHDPANALGQVLAQTLPTLNVVDLDTLRERMIPVLTAWAAAVQIITPDGTPASVTPSGHGDLPILVNTTESGETVTDFAYEVTDAQGSYWKRASGTAVRDAGNTVIARPTLEQLMAQGSATAEWTVFSGAELDFMERYLGDVLPVGDAPTNPGAALAALGPVLAQMNQTLNELTVNIAMQGALAPFFVGIGYDVASNTFKATTADQLEPMYEAIFRAAPADAAGATAWLDQWKPILDVVLGDFARGEGAEVTYGYRFVNVVAAYEAAGLPLGIVAAASALGIPSDLIYAGSATLNGSAVNDANLFYLSDGNQTAIGGAGPDNYIVGGHIGHDLITDHQLLGGGQPNTLRFASAKSTDVTAYRNGTDLVLKVNGTDEQVTVQNQFTGISPGLTGGNLADSWGVAQITFADGVVWEKPDIAFAVAPNTDGVNGTLYGTTDIDVLDAARGNHFLSGGDGGDIYLFDRGDGHATILDNETNVFNDLPNYISFGEGLSEDDVIFSRTGGSGDLTITVKDDPDDSLTVVGQFGAIITGIFGNRYVNQIQDFRFDDGTILTWEDVQAEIIAQEEAVPGMPIYGFISGDTIDPGVGGSRFMSGGDGVHTYIFGKGYGNDTIQANVSNILSGSDHRVLFNPDVDPSDVQVIRNGNSPDVTLALSDGSTLVLLNQFSKAVPLDIWFNRVGTFQFQDAAGTAWSYLDIQQKALAYEFATSHEVFGIQTDETLDPGVGAGGYLMHGEDGTDVYVFGEGYGHDTIAAGSQVGGDRTVLFNPEVDPSTVRFTRGAYDELVITLADGSELDIRNQYSPSWVDVWVNAVNTFKFQDENHTVLTYDQVARMVIADEIANGNHTVWGTQGADTLDVGQGAGGFYISGGAGNDTYAFGLGYGHDTIFTAHYPLGSTDTILFNADVDPSTVRFSRGATYDQLVITLADGSQLDINSQFDGGLLPDLYSIANFQFQDASQTKLTNLDVAKLVVQDELAGNGHVIWGTQYSDTLDPGLGRDAFLSGGNGGDLYVFGQGYGHDTIFTGHYPYPGSDTLLFNPDVDPASVRFTLGANLADLVITLADGSELDIQSEFGGLGYFYNVGTFQFQDANHTVLTVAQLPPLIFAGEEATPGAIVHGLGYQAGITLNGYGGNNTLMAGGSGNTFFFDRGYGHELAISQNGPDFVQLGAGITPDMVTLSAPTADPLAQDAFAMRNLVIGIAGTDDTLTVRNEFAPFFPVHPVTELRFADGTVWDAATLIAKAQSPQTIAGSDGIDTLIGDAVGDVLVAQAAPTVAYYTADNVVVYPYRGSVFPAGGTPYDYGTAAINGHGAGDTLIGISTFVAAGAHDTLFGSINGNNTLIASGVDDTLAFGIGHDTMIASPGATRAVVDYGNFDRVAVDLGTGHATYFSSDAGTLIGINAVSTHGRFSTLIGGVGTDTLASAGGSNTLIGGAGDSLLTSGINDLVFAAGSVVRSTGQGNVLNAGIGADTLIDSGTNDWIVGSGDGDTLIGTGSTGLTVQYLIDGTVVDLAAGTARIGGAAVADTLVDIGSVQIGGLDSTLIGRGDGAVLTAIGSRDTLIAGSGSQTLSSHNSGNTLVGGEGDNTFLYRAYDGDVEIQVLPQESWGEHSSTLQFTDLNQDALAFARIGDSLVIIVAGSGTITVDGQYVEGNGVQTLLFADGTTLTSSDILGLVETVDSGVTRSIVGDGLSIAVADQAHLTLTGASNTVSVVGDASSVLAIGDGNTVNLSATGDSATMQGANASVTAMGADATVSVEGDNGNISSFGAAAHDTLIGSFGNIAAFGEDSVARLDGDFGSITGFSFNAHLALTGDFGRISAFESGAVVTLNGDNGFVRTGGQSNVELNGNNGRITVDGGDNVFRLHGDFGDISAYGLNQDVELDGDFGSVHGNADESSFVVHGNFGQINSFGNADVELVGDYGSVLAFGDNSTVTVTGDYNSISIFGYYQTVTAIGYGQTLGLIGGNMMVSIAGNSGDALSYNSSAGNLEIHELAVEPAGSLAADNVLQLADLNVVDVVFARVGTGLQMTVSATGAVVLIADEFVYDSYGNNPIQQIQFADGTVWTGADLIGSAPLVVTDDDVSVTLSVAGDTARLEGDNDHVTMAGANETVTSIGAGNSIVLTGSQSTATADGDNASVVDHGTGNTVVLNGDHAQGELYGTGGTIVSTGAYNYLIVTGTQSVTVTGEHTGINNLGDDIDITLSASGDYLSMNGNDGSATVTGDHISVSDFGDNNVTTLSGNYSTADLQGTNGTLVSTGHDNTISLWGDSQTVTISGENTYVRNAGTGLEVTLAEAGDSIDLQQDSSGNTTTLTGDGLSVRDFGTGNLTTMSGDNQLGQFFGTGGTIVSTGRHNNLIIIGTNDVTVTGEDTGINNQADDIDITLSADGNAISMYGANGSVTATGDRVSVSDNGANNVTTLSGNFSSADLSGTNGTLVSTGHDNTVSLWGDSQTVTVSGENSYVRNAGTGLEVTLDAAGDSIDLQQESSGNTTTLTGDGLSVRDFGTGNATTMAGDNQLGQFFGTGGTIVSSGRHNNLIIIGTNDVTVTGEDTGINNQADDIDIVLGADGNTISMYGANGSVTATGDRSSVWDNGANNVTTLSGNFSNANLSGTNGTLVSTGHDNTISLWGDSQTVTVTGENSYVRNAGTGLDITLDAAGDSIDLQQESSGNTTTLTGDGLSVRDFGTGNLTTMSGDNQIGQFFGAGGTVVSSGSHNYLIVLATVTLTVTGDNTGINNQADDIDVTLSATGNSISMYGANGSVTATGDHSSVWDNGSNNMTELSGNYSDANLSGINGTLVSTGHDNTISLWGDSQTVTVSGENSYVRNAGTGLDITLDAAGDSIDLQQESSGNTTTLTGDGLSVRDFGTGNLTTMSGDSQIGQFFGAGGTVVSSGAHNYLILVTTVTLTVTGEYTGINNLADDIDIVLSASGDQLSMNGNDGSATVTGDHISVSDNGSNNVTVLSGNYSNADLSGTNGTLVSTGHDNTISLWGDSQTVTISGENSYVRNAGTGLEITLAAAGDSIDLQQESSGNTTTLSADDTWLRDFGTGNLTTLSGDGQTGQFFGTASVVSSTGDDGYLILQGNGLDVTVSGAGTGINNLGDGSTVTLAGAGDRISISGSGNTTTIAADGVSVSEDGGTNHFVIASGAGNDSLHIENGDGTDSASFGAGIAYDQLWFAQAGQDLVMSVIGRPQSLTVTGWFDGAANHLGEVETADGYQIDDGGIEQLVQAMASYQPPSPGQTTLPPGLAADLAPILASTWQHS
jgi:Ca2+-binding RTX toxin-like protein